MEPKTPIVLLAAALIAAAGIATPASAHAQEGANAGCLDFLVLWQLDGVHSPVGDSERVETTPGAAYSISSADGEAVIDFYSADGVYLAFHGASGIVPAGAAYGYVCIVLLGDWPDVPVPGATFTYSD